MYFYLDYFYVNGSSGHLERSSFDASVVSASDGFAIPSMSGYPEQKIWKKPIAAPGIM
jgi:hypothetical protein